MAQLYRKSLLDKLSSPEQLDKMIVITPPSFWIALSGAFLIIVSAVIWGIFGTLPVNVSTQGIYINSGGTSTVYSETTGVIEEVFVSEGQEVKVGDVIASVTSEEIDKNISDLEERIANVQAITLYSTNDTVNSDSSNLLEIKNQLTTINTTVNADTAMLNLYKSQLETAKANLETAKKTYEDAEKAYFNSANATDSVEYYEYSTAQTYYRQAESAYISAKNAFDAASCDYDTETTADKCTTDIRTAYTNAKNAYDSAKETYESAKAAYEKKVGTSTSTEIQTAYQTASSAYSTAQSTVTQLESQVAQYETQVSNDKSSVSSQVTSVTKQFNAAKQAVINSLQKELDSYNTQKDNTNITATSDGVISNVSVSVGGIVQQGSEVAKVKLGEDDDNVVILYVPVSTGKKIKEGMEVMVYPTTVNKQEYGHMEATVLSVSSYVSSTDDMKRRLGNDQVVESFLSSGPVVEVVCKLKEDTSTTSGYYWSSKKGKSLTLDTGTMVSADVVTERKAPITMLIPYLKEKLTITTDNSTSGS